MEEINQKIEELSNKISDLTNKLDIVSTLANVYVDVKNISSVIETVSSAPTHTPTNFYDQFKLYRNSTTYRLYIYDVQNGAWRYVALT